MRNVNVKASEKKLFNYALKNTTSGNQEKFSEDESWRRVFLEDDKPVSA